MPKLKIRGTYHADGTITLEKKLDISEGAEIEVDVFQVYDGKYPLIAGQVAIYLARTEIEAGFVVEALGEDGIEADIYSQRDHMVVTTIGDLSLVRVIVSPKDVPQAEKVIERLHDEGMLGGSEDVSWGDGDDEDEDE